MANIEIIAHMERELFAQDDYRLLVMVQLNPPVKEIRVGGNNLARVAAGSSYRIIGEQKHDKYGDYLQAITVTIADIPNKAAAEKFFATLKCGMGKKRANACWDKFGSKLLSVLSTDPSQLLQAGIPETVVKKVSDAMGELLVQQKVQMHYGIALPDKAVSTMLRHWGTDAARKVIENPFSLCELPIDYAVADRLAATERTEVSWYALERVYGICKKVIQTHKNRGSVCIAPGELLHECKILTNAVTESGRLTEQYLKVRINSLVTRNDLVYYAKNIYLAEDATDEELIVEKLWQLARSGNRNVSETDRNSLQEFQKAHTITLSDDQKNAVEGTLKANLSIIVGSAGTGKSTITQAIVHLERCRKKNAKVLLLAPTGRAARRLGECVGAPATTIHSAIGYYTDADGISDAHAPMLEADLIIVDEASMVDQRLARLLLERIDAQKTKVVLVGDTGQLPSVAYGNVLADVVASEALPVYFLTTIHRQKQGSLLIENALRINKGETELDFSLPYGFVPCQDAQIEKAAVELYKRAVKKYGLDNVLLLCPYRNKSEVQCDTLNACIHDILNPMKNGMQTLKSMGTEYRAGDYVMQMRNVEDVYNGDIGRILKIGQFSSEEDGKNELMAEIDFGNGRIVRYNRGKIKDINLAYATTVHKAQGQEAAVTIFLATMLHAPLLRRNLLYTAMTRAKQSVVVIGDENAIKKAIRTNSENSRVTGLVHRLRELKKSWEVSHKPQEEYQQEKFL